MIDYQNRRAIVVEGYDAVMTLTTARDLAAVVARAVDLDGEWPVIGGISGNRLAVSQILKFGEKVRGMPPYNPIHTLGGGDRVIYTKIVGGPFTIDKVNLEDLENGNLQASWALETRHPSFTGNKDVASVLKTVLIGTLLSSAKGAWAASDEFNQLLPDYKFTQIEDFLAKVWEGKP